MKVSYRTFTGSASYTADVGNFKDFMCDIRKQLCIDTESQITVACGGRVFRDPNASLEDVVRLGKPILVRYALSAASLENRRKGRKIIKVQRNSNVLIILDDCMPTSSVKKSAVSPTLRRQQAVTVEDENEDNQDENKEEENKENNEDIITDSSPMVVSQEEIAVIAATISESESAWRVFQRGPVPAPYNILDENFIRGIRRAPDNLRTLVAVLAINCPQIIRRMMLAATVGDSDNSSASSDSNNSNAEEEEHVSSPRASRRVAIGQYNNNELSDDDNDQEDNQDDNSDEDNSDNEEEEANRQGAISPSRQVIIDLIADMMQVSVAVSENALRVSNFDQNIAIDYIIQNRDNPRIIAPVPVAGAIIASRAPSRFADAVRQGSNNNSQRRQPSLNNNSMLAHRIIRHVDEIQPRINPGVQSSYRGDFDGEQFPAGLMRSSPVFDFSSLYPSAIISQNAQVMAAPNWQELMRYPSNVPAPANLEDVPIPPLVDNDGNVIERVMEEVD